MKVRTKHTLNHQNYTDNKRAIETILAIPHAPNQNRLRKESSRLVDQGTPMTDTILRNRYNSAYLLRESACKILKSTCSKYEYARSLRESACKISNSARYILPSVCTKYESAGDEHRSACKAA